VAEETIDKSFNDAAGSGDIRISAELQLDFVWHFQFQSVYPKMFAPVLLGCSLSPRPKP
jgi:hypothetical protein